MNRNFIPGQRAWFRVLSCAVVFVTAAAWPQTSIVERASAGSIEPALIESSSSLIGEEKALPDAPGFLAQLDHSDEPPVQPKDPEPGPAPVAMLRNRRIAAGDAYHPIDAGNKVYIGLRNTYSYESIGEWFLASGWSHIRDGQPHYGTDRGAYGQRLGAAVINETAQTVLQDSVFAVIFREDPRYFVEGRNYSFWHRAFHAASRVLVTRNDNGTDGPNYALFSSYAAMHAIDLSFYPTRDRKVGSYMAGYGLSLGGAALGNAVDEFLDDALTIVHLKKRPGE